VVGYTLRNLENKQVSLFLIPLFAFYTSPPRFLLSLVHFADWSKTWLMDFNIKKCATLSISRKKKPSIYQYSIHGEPLQRVDEHDYLGVTISKDLSWNKHTQNVIKKSNQTLGLLRRTLAPCHSDVKIRAYESLIRPRLEYASEVWNPYTSTLVDRLEQVQRAAARFVFRDYRRTTRVTPLIDKIGWDSLHTRRLVAQNTMFYKIHHNLVNISMPSAIQPATYFARLDHSLKYAIPIASIDSYKYSFYPRSVRIWNQLPVHAVTALTPSAFRVAALPVIRVLCPPPGSNLL
jgi:hypothetical protein